MTAWTPEELERIGNTEQLQMAPMNPEGALREPVPIWVVRVGDGLYVRSYRGRSGAWYQAAEASHQGRVRADGVEKDVSLMEETDEDTNREVDSDYRTKYQQYADTYVEPMVSGQARETTLKLVPV